MFERVRNLWRISQIDMPKPEDGKPVSQKIREAVTGKKMATIVEMDELQDMFPEQ